MNRKALSKLEVTRLVDRSVWKHHRDSETDLLCRQFAEGLKPFVEDSLGVASLDTPVMGKVESLRASVLITTENALLRQDKEEEGLRVMRLHKLADEVLLLIHMHEQPKVLEGDVEGERARAGSRYLNDAPFRHLVDSIVVAAGRFAEGGRA